MCVCVYVCVHNIALFYCTNGHNHCVCACVYCRMPSEMNMAVISWGVALWWNGQGEVVESMEDVEIGYVHIQLPTDRH